MTSPGEMNMRVDITMTGRGGGIAYHEGEHVIDFDWEFALSPAIALVWGPRRADWDARYQWAAGRQAPIYEFVGAEIVRQKAPDGRYEYDLDPGHLTIFNSITAEERKRRAAAAAAELAQHISVDARLAAAEVICEAVSCRLPGAIGRPTADTNAASW